jgi:chromosome segregation ATPase
MLHQRKNVRVLEEQLQNLEKLKEELRKKCDQQTMELDELNAWKRRHIKEHETELGQERHQRMELEKECVKLKAELEMVKKEHEHLDRALHKSQQNELELSRDISKSKDKVKSLEQQLADKEHELRQSKLEEEKRFQALEMALGNYVKMTFAETRKH